MTNTQRKVKIRLLVAQIIAIIPFLLFIFYLFDLWYDTQRALIMEKNITVAQLTGNTIYNAFLVGKNVSIIISSDSIYSKLSTNATNSDNSELNTIFEGLREQYPEVLSLSVYTTQTDLQVTTISSEKNKQEKVVADRSNDRDVLALTNDNFQTLQVDKIDGHPVIIASQPVQKDNNATGVVRIVYDLETLKSKMETINMENRVEVIILDNEGKIVFALHKNLLDNEEKTMLVNNPHIKKALAGERSFLENEKVPSVKKNVIGVSEPIKPKEINWVVLAVSPIDNIFASLTSMQRILWLILVTALTFSVTIVSYLLRNVRIVY